MTALRGLQQEFNFHGVIWKNNPPIRYAIQNPGAQQCRDISVHGLDVASEPAGCFPDSLSPGEVAESTTDLSP